MFEFLKGKKKPASEEKATDRDKAIALARYQVTAGSQRTTGERSEMCAGAMNNNQRLATMQMLRDFRDD